MGEVIVKKGHLEQDIEDLDQLLSDYKSGLKSDKEVRTVLVIFKEKEKRYRIAIDAQAAEIKSSLRNQIAIAEM